VPAAGPAARRKGQLPSLVRDQWPLTCPRASVCATAAHSAWLNSWPGWDPGREFGSTGLEAEARRAAVRRALAKEPTARPADRSGSASSSGGQTANGCCSRLRGAPATPPVWCSMRPQAGLGQPRWPSSSMALLFDLRRRRRAWTVLQVSPLTWRWWRRTCGWRALLNLPPFAAPGARSRPRPLQLERVYGRGFVPYHHRQRQPIP